MRDIKLLLILVLLISTISTPAGAQEILECNNNKIDVHYFYSTGCTHCANIKQLVEVIANNREKYPDILVHRHEIHDGDDYALFNIACNQFNIKTKGVPLVIVGDTYYQGDKEIIENLKDRITKEKKPEDFICQISCSQIQNITIQNNEDLELTWPIIITSGLIDGINPCAFAVLIFLAATLVLIGNRKKMIIIGTVYITTVYVTYFIAGLGLLTVIQYAGLTKIIFSLAAVIAIIFGLINLKDFFWYGKGPTLKIAENKKSTISRYAKKATIPSAIILGFLVSLFELPCTGGVYFAIIGLLSSKMTQVAAIPYLLIYNLAFIAPLIIILAIIYKGADPKTIDSWRFHERKWMKLSMGLLMLILGILMLGGYI